LYRCAGCGHMLFNPPPKIYGNMFPLTRRSHKGPASLSVKDSSVREVAE
jgi:hypothetical protein